MHSRRNRAIEKNLSLFFPACDPACRYPWLEINAMTAELHMRVSARNICHMIQFSPMLVALVGNLTLEIILANTQEVSLLYKATSLSTALFPRYGHLHINGLYLWTVLAPFLPCRHITYLPPPHNSPAADLPWNDCEIRVFIVLVKLCFRSRDPRHRTVYELRNSSAGCRSGETHTS